MELPKCYNCKLLHINGFGYSDWTWMESEMQCLADKFEDIDQDDKEEKGLLTAASEKCGKYVKGEPLETSPDDKKEKSIKKHMGKIPK